MADKLNKGHLYQTDYKADFESVPLKEYPRPNLVRDSYLSLNGKWDYKVSKDKKLPKSYQGFINVPYAIESPLSGVNHLLEPDEYIFYKRTVNLDESFKGKEIIIHFDGVDQIADVFIDSKNVFSHSGGYSAFEVHLKYVESFELVVRVKDVTDSLYYERGKQVLNPTGWFYSSSSGIYKPVWIEGVSSNYVQEVLIRSYPDEKEISVYVKTSVAGIVTLKIGDLTRTISTDKKEVIKFDSIHLWSPDDPFLYQVEVSSPFDKVSTYFAFRKIEIKEDKKGFKRIYLNGEKIFISGLLNQGYYYLGNLTPRSYKDYEDDISKTKELGFNCLRVHIKIENQMFYYLADKLGMLLIQDFPCGGRPYKFVNVVAPRIFTFLNEKNITYKKLGREDEQGRKDFVNLAFEIVHKYLFHPSIIIYTIFNEGWGEFEPSKLYKALKRRYPSVLFDTASGWYDAESDFYSIHTYTFPKMNRRDKKKRAFIISEMGGMGLKVKDHSYFEGFFSHGPCKDEHKLNMKFDSLYKRDILPMIKKRGLNMTIYTELCDCESEYNGILTFDREVLKLEKMRVKHVNELIYKEISSS